MLKKIIFPAMTIGNLPTSYLESLTYLEQIMLLNNKVNEIIDYLKEIDITQIETLIDNKISDIKKYIDNQDKLIYNKIDDNFNNFKNVVNNKINEINEVIKNLLEQKINILYNYIDKQNSLLKYELLNEIEKLKKEIENISFKKIKAYNPTNSYMENINKVIKNIYDYLRYYGITCLQFDVKGLTAKQFDNMQITAKNFDLFSKIEILDDLKHTMISPFTRST